MDYIDTSAMSIGIGCVIFIAVLVGFMNLLPSLSDKFVSSTETTTILASLAISIAITFACLVIWKKIMIYRESKDLLEEPY
jgi:predicted membrane protein